MAKLEIKFFKEPSLPTSLEPNAIYFILENNTSAAKMYITTKAGIPIPLIDETITGSVATVTGTGVTGTTTNPKVDIATFVSSQLGNQIYLSAEDGKLQVNPITTPDNTLEVTETSTELQIKLASSIVSQINSAIQSGDNISELNNDAGYITIADLPSTVIPHTHPISDIVNLQTSLDSKVDKNTPITGATKTKISYDAKGLVTSGTDATTADIIDSSNKRYVTDSDVINLNNLSGVNTGDQTSIVGISGTKAQFNSALTDGDFLFVGDTLGYTDEQAQNAVGTILDGSSTIIFGYDILTPSITASIIPNSIDETQLADDINISTFVNDSGFETPSQLDIRDTNNRNRANHTGTQLSSTISDFTTSARAAAVEDQITDGVIDIAPSQNVVYDSLLLKEDVANKSDSYTVSSSLTYASTKAVVGGIEVSDLYNRGSAIKPTTTKKYGLLVAGQSNTDGRVPLVNAPVWLNQSDPTLSGVNMYNRNTGLFAPFKLGVNTGADNNADTRWAYDMVTYYLLQGYLADDIYIIKRSKGGTPISTLSATSGGFWEAKQELITTTPKLLGDLETQYIAAKAANPDFEIRAFLWHQGESDSDNATSIANYYQNFKNVITYVRGFTGNPRLPIVFGTVSTLSAQYNATIKAAQLQIAAEDPFAYVVDMGAAALLDAYHFNATSSESLGTSMYNIIKDFTDYTLHEKEITENEIDLAKPNIITGSLTAGRIPKSTGANTLGDSLIQDNTTTVDILTEGVINGVKIGRGAGLLNTNTVVGRSAFSSNVTGGFCSIFGNGAGAANLASGNDFFGYFAGNLNTTGSSISAFGRSALGATVTGNNLSGFGNSVLFSLNGASGVSALGTQAGYYKTTGDNDLILGYRAARNIADGTTTMTNSSNSTFVGTLCKPLGNGETNQIVIGYTATGLGSNTSVIGNSSTTQTWLGGKLTVGKTTNDGVNDIQANGTVSSGSTTLGTSQPTDNNQLTRKDFVEAGLALKANLASPAFTGTPTAPTATAGTNTTQIATTAFVQATTNSNALLLTGNQTFSGTKSGTYSDATTTQISLTNTVSTGSGYPLVINNSSTSISTNAGAVINNNNNSSASSGLRIINFSTGGSGFTSGNTSTGIGSNFYNVSTGVCARFESNTGSTGDLIQFTKNNSVTGKVDQNGEITVPKYRLSALNTAPASATDTGTTGEIRVTDTYIYVCTATNTWVRTALTTW